MRIRREWPVIAALVCLVALQCSTAYGDVYKFDFEVDGIYYTRLNDSEVEVSQNATTFPYSGNFVIPEKVVNKSTTYDVVAIGKSAFWGSKSTSSISLPPTIKIIKAYAFDGSGITSITLPASLEEIGKGAFYGCDNLTSLTIPASVVSIGEPIASKCSNLMEINVEEGNPNYRSIDGVLYTADCATLLQFPCAEASVEIAPSVRTVAPGAFSGSLQLTSIEFPESLEAIESGAFDCCRNLSAVSFKGDALVSIGGGAFSGCRGLKTILLPNSIKHIGNNAFWGCDSLESINLPDSLESLSTGVFSGCEALKSIILPNSLKSIGDNTFDGCETLESIIIPNSVKSIGAAAFWDCRNLKTAILPESLTIIDRQLFANCEILESIKIPSSVESIGYEAFFNCKYLESIELPESLVEIGEKAFSNTFPEYIDCKAQVPPQASEDTFNPDSYGVVLYVPEGSEDAYKKTSPWNKFEHIRGSDFLEVGTIEDSGRISVRVNNGEVIIEGAEEGIPVLVFDLSGRLVRQCAAPVVGIPAPGAYLIVVGKERLKVVI